MPTVLIVDDSLGDRQLIEGLLKQEPDLVLLFAEDGTEALPLMHQQRVDAVLTDMLMPRMNGLELVELVQQQFPMVPIILMTSQGNDLLAVQALRAGASNYLPKSALVGELVEVVRQVLALSSRKRTQARLIECMRESVCSFELQCDSSLIPALVAYLQDEAMNIGLCDSAGRVRVGVALDEALVNALYHGNFELSSHQRDADPGEYHRLVELRRENSPYRDRKIHVTAQFTATEGRFVIRDEGPGFDAAKLPDPTDPANLEHLGGRGVLLMRTFMDEVTFNAAGNEVTMFKRNRHKPRNANSSERSS